MISTFPNPILVDFEQGEGVLWDRGINIPRLRPASADDVYEILTKPQIVAERHFPGYNVLTWGFDTVSVMQDLFLESVLRRSRNVPMNDRPDQNDYGAHFKAMCGFFKMVRNMPYHTVCTAHAELIEDKKTGAIEGWPMLIGKLRQRSLALCDISLYLEAVPRGTAMEYAAHTVSTGRWYARSRYKLPARIINPSYSNIISVLHKEAS